MDISQRKVLTNEHMARAPVTKPQNKRGSPEAVEKRRVARLFNDVLGGASSSPQRDGRTEKRRQRLMKELEEGMARGKRELKPIDVLLRVQELLELGEPLSHLRKVVKVRALPSETSSEGLVDVVARLHEAYGFRPESYRFVGIADEVLAKAGIALEGEDRKKRPVPPMKKTSR